MADKKADIAINIPEYNINHTFSVHSKYAYKILKLLQREEGKAYRNEKNIEPETGKATE